MEYKGTYNPDEQRRGIMPVAEYDFDIIEAEEIESAARNPMLKLVLQPVKEPYEKRKLWHHIVLNNDYTDGNIGCLLDSIGRDPSLAVSFKAEQLIGKRLTAMIKHENYKGRDQEKIHYIVGQSEIKKRTQSPSRQAESSAGDSDVPF